MSNGKIIGTGLELLRQRSSKSEELEEVLKFLPDKAQLFFKYYETGNWETMFSSARESVRLESINTLCGVALMYWFEEENYKDMFGELLTLDKLALEHKSYESKKEDYHQSGFIKLGYMMHWDLIYLGIENHNKDEIWVLGNGVGSNKLTYFKQNIFDFFSSSYLQLTDEDLRDYTKNKFNGKHLYKYWGDELWRIGKEEHVV